MMARRYSRTYRSAAQAHAKVTAARQELLAEAGTAVLTEEPMRRYSHPIPTAATAPETTVSACSCSEDASATMTQALEQLSCQSQLLVDLLGAVNSLTAALLAQNGKN